MDLKLKIFLLVACTIIFNGILFKLYVTAKVQAVYQYEFRADDNNLNVQEKRNKIKEMMLHAWKNYKFYAWGKNELKPLSKTANKGIFGRSDLGISIIDGLDTLYLMGLSKEFEEGKEWIAKNFTLENTDEELSVFETNIRLIGGFLSLYAFTGDNLFKEKAQYVADKLLPAFKTPTGIPYGLVNMQSGESFNYIDASILSEFGTLHLEFSYLSDITGNPLYKKIVQDIRKFLKNIEKPKGLYPNHLDPKTGEWSNYQISLGGQGDSFYEYLLKSWIQSGKIDEEAREMFDDVMKVIVEKMVRRSEKGSIYISNLNLNNNFEALDNTMEHLACFAGGLFALGAKTKENDNSHMFMRVGKGLTETCHKSYDMTPTKLGPAEFRFTKLYEAIAQKSNKNYNLYPETIESYFILWRLTHNQKYRDWGWEAVQALEKHCRVPHGYSGLKDVYQYQGEKDDVQQSYFLAETLKYLYLLFSNDSLLALDEWVFNTEAHPLPIKGANIFYRMAT